MKKAGFGVLAVSLALGIGAVVSTLLAQTPAPFDSPQGSPEQGPGAPLPDPAPTPRARELRIRDGRGSRLGLSVRDLTVEDLRATSGVTSGARIEEIARDSAGQKAGLRIGDVVVEFDGERVRSARQFSRLVQETPDGRTVKMGIVRGGEKQSVEVTPERALAWHFDLDEDRIRRDVERGLRGLDRLPYFDFNGRPFAYEWRDRDELPRESRGRLGVQLDPLTPQLAEYFGAKDGGVLVSGVTPGTPAEKAGLKAGDVIVSINGARVRDVGDLRSELRESPTDLSIGIVRDKKETTLKGTVPQP